MSVVECEKAKGAVICGHVKWYDPDRGFGFIIDQVTGEDILLGVGAMKRFGWSAIARGSKVSAQVSETLEGTHVVEILDITASDELADCNVFDFDSLDYLASAFVPARVCWYNRKKGYGFASTYGDSDGCFLHWRALEQAGLLDLDSGDAIAIRIGRGKNGRVAASVRRSNAASKPSGNEAMRLALFAA